MCGRRAWNRFPVDIVIRRKHDAEDCHGAGRADQTQKEFLIKFAYWAVWGGLVLAAVKLIGPVLLPFIAAFFVAWILSFPVVFVTERMHIRRGIAAVAVVLLFYGLAGLLIGFLGNRIMLLGQELLGEVVRFVSETIFPMMKHFCAWTAGMSGETVGGEVLRTAGTESAEAVSRAGELLTGNVRHPAAAGLRHRGEYSGDVL